MKYKYVYLIQIWVNFLCISCEQSKWQKDWKKGSKAEAAKKKTWKNIKLFFRSTFGGREKYYYYLIFAAFDVANSCQSHLSAHNARHTFAHTQLPVGQFACYKALHILRRPAAAAAKTSTKTATKSAFGSFFNAFFITLNWARRNWKEQNPFPVWWTSFFGLYCFCN